MRHPASCGVPSGWLRASATACRLMSLVGLKWSCLRMNEPDFPSFRGRERGGARPGGSGEDLLGMGKKKLVGRIAIAPTSSPPAATEPRQLWGYNPTCKVTPVILHGGVSLTEGLRSGARDSHSPLPKIQNSTLEILVIRWRLAWQGAPHITPLNPTPQRAPSPPPAPLPCLCKVTPVHPTRGCIPGVLPAILHGIVSPESLRPSYTGLYPQSHSGHPTRGCIPRPCRHRTTSGPPRALLPCTAHRPTLRSFELEVFESNVECLVCFDFAR